MRAADILVGGAVLPRPFPHILEHAPVKPFGEGFLDRIASAFERPAGGFEDILLFQFVQLAAQGDVGGDKTFALIGCQWCGVIGMLV